MLNLLIIFFIIAKHLATFAINPFPFREARIGCFSLKKNWDMIASGWQEGIRL